MNSRTAELPQGHSENNLDLDECRALLERVAGSVQLKRAARLREFLLFVGHRALKDGCTEIHEQEIGEHVFDRASHYDTSQDNIVRVNATELRKRIEAYFSAEGAGETLVLEIPRGGYKPIFRRRPIGERVLESNTAIQPTVSPVAISTEAAKGDPVKRERRLLIAVSLVALILAACSLVLLQQNRGLRQSLYAWQGNPALTAFWADFLNSSPQVDIILGDTSIALIEDITGRPVSLNDYLNHRYLNEIQAMDLSADRKSDIDRIVPRNNGSFGDFRVARRILALEPTSGRFRLQFAPEYTAEAIKRDNVILVGNQKSNPWVGLIYDRLNFRMDYDQAKYQTIVRNRQPLPGEQATYVAPADPDAPLGYSVIAFLPNPSHTASILMIGGTDSKATDAAGEFLTSEESLAKFQDKLGVKKLPYFEVLLRTTHLSGTPFGAEVVAYRVYPAAH